MKPTAAKTPWSSGIVERHNAVIGKMINKWKFDSDNAYLIEAIFSWAISAKKKALQHYKVYDFTPTQLVFGRNPNLLSNLANLLLAMEDVSHGDIVVKHLNTLDQ